MMEDDIVPFSLLCLLRVILTQMFALLLLFLPFPLRQLITLSWWRGPNNPFPFPSFEGKREGVSPRVSFQSWWRGPNNPFPFPSFEGKREGVSPRVSFQCLVTSFSFIGNGIGTRINCLYPEFEEAGDSLTDFYCRFLQFFLNILRTIKD